MKPEPPRLIDDPSFLAETGCNLADEAAGLEAPRLPELRARLMASVAAPKAPIGGRGWPIVGGGILLVALWWWMGDKPAAPMAAAPAPAATPVTAVAAARAPVLPVESLAPDAAVPATRPRAAAASRPRPATVATPTVATPTVPTQRPLPAPTEAPRTALSPVPTADAGDLARQLTAFEVGEDRLAQGDLGGALAAHEAYLARWPKGHFRAEAEFETLRATAALGDAAASEAIAARLAEDPALATRRGEILALRLSALVQLNRCEEARALATALSTPSARKTAAACR